MQTHLHSRQEIRKHIRQLRRSLTPEQQQQAAQQAAEHALSFAPLQQANHIALFLSVDGELDTRPLIQQLWQQQKQVYLPVLHPFSPGNLLFLRYDEHTELKNSRLHIPEPVLDITRLLPLEKLDLLIVPLVAFDAQGQRLGMGGGFYDRTLQNWQQQVFLPVGFAHNCQQVEKLPVEKWDIPLPALITPAKIWQW